MSRSRNPRVISLEILRRVEVDQAYADILLDNAFKRESGLDSRDKRFVTELVYGCLRWQGKLDWIISNFSRKKLSLEVLLILRLGVYQLIFLNKVPPYAVVNEAVKLARRFGHGRAAGFVNGVLRSVESKQEKIAFLPLIEDPVSHIASVYSHPKWMVERWLRMFGQEETISLCTANNQTPPLTLRTNTLKISREELSHYLRKKTSVAQKTSFSPEGLSLKGADSFLWEDESYQKGWFQVQDEASQLIPHLLSPQKGEAILDVCAAPGGKSTHIAQLIRDRGEVWAVELNAARLKLLKENCSRQDITSIKPILGDINRSLPPLKGKKFHRILVDPPCSGLGVLRRNPEGKWRVKERDITTLADIQKKILESASRYLLEGGTLVYSTCTITPEENTGVLEGFLDAHPDFSLEPVSGLLPESCADLTDENGFFRSHPHHHSLDGFFAARLKKNPG
ncbi:MAG: 16S rRNA (cytosine(967)-C(5))-methyltransferase RsmB [Deltaproteobacteria bacterium]|nr:MAG: 16S rRNA (cytosine(967)-C(5))-methyltransferase RsmB [Deltaproteobacteria bacterium]